MPYRSRASRLAGRARRRGPPTAADQLAVRLFKISWLFSTAAALLYLAFLPLRSSDERRVVAFCILVSPCLAFPLVGLVLLICEHIGLIIAIWGPLSVAAGLVLRFSTSEHRDDIALVIIALPLEFWCLVLSLGSVIALCYFAGVIVLVLSELLFYSLLFWRWVFTLPRYRVSDPFASSKLCDNCKGMLRESSLLFGSWRLLVRRAEHLEYRPTSQVETRDTQPNCQLCSFLLKDYDASIKIRALCAPRNYRTLVSEDSSSLRHLEDGRMTLKLESGRWSCFDLPPFESDLYIQLQAPNLRTQRFKINQEAPSKKHELYSCTSSTSVTEIVRGWISDCMTHKSCRRSHESSFIPTRLVHVGTGAQPVLHLIETVELTASSPPRYCAFSHCWGNDVVVMLTSTHHAAMKENIDLESLSQNFRDAIVFTRTLGIEYLWIDSLCIMQDSKEDWARESVLMMDVYSNAVCTISATASSSSKGGCFRNRFIGSSSCTLISKRNKVLRMSTSIAPTLIGFLFETRVEDAPLNKRAWVFQERLLSKRVVHFCSDTVLFECNTVQASEANVKGSKYQKASYVLFKGRAHNSPESFTQPSWNTALKTWQRLNVIDATESSALLKDLSADEVEDHTPTRGIRGALDTMLSLNAANNLTLWEQLEFNQRWYELVSRYSGTDLTRPTDRLIAIAGIARLIEKTANAAYMAGLWSNVVPEFGLLWRVSDPGERETTYCAPSWSWASVNRRVDLLPHIAVGQAGVEFHTRMERVSFALKGLSAYGAANHVDEGYIEVIGLVGNLSCSPISPGILRHHRGGVPQGIEFFPDYRDDNDASPADCPKVGQEADHVEEELIALLVLTSPHGATITNADGLVLRTKRNAQSITEFERIGVFRSAVQDLAAFDEWTEQSLRIY